MYLLHYLRHRQWHFKTKAAMNLLNEPSNLFIYLIYVSSGFFFAFLRFAQKMFPITLLLYLQLLFISDVRQFALLKGI